MSEAHASPGLALSLDPYRWTTAEPSFRRALELNPDYGPAHQWYGAHLARMRRTKEAIRETKLPLDADPVSLPISVVLGWMYYYDRQHAAAAEQGLRTVDLDSTFLYGYLLLAEHMPKWTGWTMRLQPASLQLPSAGVPTPALWRRLWPSRTTFT